MFSMAQHLALVVVHMCGCMGETDHQTHLPTYDVDINRSPPRLVNGYDKCYCVYFSITSCGLCQYPPYHRCGTVTVAGGWIQRGCYLGGLYSVMF